MEKKQTFHDIIHGEKPVLVDFSAEWCGPCKMMAPIIDDVAKDLGQDVRILKVDVDRNPKAATAYQIQGVPTLILFKDGKVLWRQSGVVPGHVLKQVIRQKTE
ncbi:MAG: thioredoxin [Cyclobacteriaceae bacterium]|nr:thioredoxin [Cyclobacteriaceae bacterium]